MIFETPHFALRIDEVATAAFYAGEHAPRADRRFAHNVYSPDFVEGCAHLPATVLRVFAELGIDPTKPDDFFVSNVYRTPEGQKMAEIGLWYPAVGEVLFNTLKEDLGVDGEGRRLGAIHMDHAYRPEPDFPFVISPYLFEFDPIPGLPEPAVRMEVSVTMPVCAFDPWRGS